MARSAVKTRRPTGTRKAAGSSDPSIAAARRIGVLVTAAGALIMIAGVFLPWLAYAGRGKLSGWAVYQDHVDSGGNGFVIVRMFSPEVRSIFFTGFTILIAAVLIILACLWILALARSDRLGRARLDGHVAFPAMQLATLTLGLVIVDLIMVLAGRHTEEVRTGPGLYVVVAGALVACLGMYVAVGVRRGG